MMLRKIKQRILASEASRKIRMVRLRRLFNMALDEKYASPTGGGEVMVVINVRNMSMIDGHMLNLFMRVDDDTNVGHIKAEIAATLRENKLPRREIVTLDFEDEDGNVTVLSEDRQKVKALIESTKEYDTTLNVLFKDDRRIRQIIEEQGTRCDSLNREGTHVDRPYTCGPCKRGYITQKYGQNHYGGNKPCVAEGSRPLVCEEYNHDICPPECEKVDNPNTSNGLGSSLCITPPESC